MPFVRDIFARQLAGFVEPGDVAIAISGSGKAVAVARAAGARTIGFAGFEGGRLKDIVDDAVVAPGHDMGQCEDAHHVLQHLICSVLREEQAESAS